ncbi:efflux transporter, RND family, MFP subunit [Sulfuricella denitrificans skB26]|uniref:Efflux transporter, RND family, MFP subunit n=1 Tax=Sulfuricella denitrificans (strain DSM 22764 / NBRC 105220 / skB26) TaxID=1163617 RepID=S6B5B8_SULDS|nr:efflux RND transporter periplasmic adaptor subunit [Sulfuricella denitrificans]BAN35727.1 efflux transporter, RND family, MFP subunit [Sulfuricella denitrificans skB26]
MRKAQYLRASLGALLLCGFIVATPLQAGDEIKLSPAQAKAMGVATAPLASTVTTGGKGLPARVVIPNHQLHIVSAPLAGMVETILVSPNQVVKKGQVLARLQSPGLVEIQRGFLQAATQEQLARESLSRDEKLFKEGIVAESRYLAAKGRHVEAVAALSERRQALALAGLSSAALQRLEKSHAMFSTIEITAPVNGVALELMAVPGQRIEAAMPLAKLAQIVPLWLDIQAPLAQVAGLKAGGAVSVPAYQASGKVAQIGRGVEEGSQTVTVRAEIRQGAENLRPGQFVEAVLAVDSDDKHWHVPNSALVRQREQAYVFVQTTTGFLAKSVKLGGETAGNSVVIAEFKGDERIAVSGTVSLKAMWQGLAAGGE